MKIDGSHITINKGDTGVIRFIFEHKKHLIPLENRQFRLIIKKHKEDADGSAIFDNTKGPANTTDAYIAWALNDSVTNNEAGSYFWGLRVVTSGFVSTLQEGIFTIEQGTYHGVNA